MIPQFPEFKKLKFSDKKDVESFTHKYPPYSDFNFVNLWSWNLKDEAKISQSDGNFIIKFTDYITNEPFYSFLGDQNRIKTANRLLELCKEEGVSTKLRLIPEVTAEIFGLDNGFVILEDRDHFDYLYKIESLITMNGSGLASKRQQARHFENTFEHEVKQLDLSDQNTKNQVLNLFHNWASDKLNKIPSYFFQNEYRALERFLDFGKQIIGVGIYVEDKLIASTFSEKVSNEYAISHFQKALTNFYKGLNPYLSQQVAKLLKNDGIKFHNFEQDLGIPGLRASKESYQPNHHLKKYTISRVSPTSI